MICFKVSSAAIVVAIFGSVHFYRSSKNSAALHSGSTSTAHVPQPYTRSSCTDLHCCNNIHCNTSILAHYTSWSWAVYKMCYNNNFLTTCINYCYLHRLAHVLVGLCHVGYLNLVCQDRICGGTDTACKTCVCGGLRMLFLQLPICDHSTRTINCSKACSWDTL